MRALPVFLVVVGSVLAGSVALNCSSTPGEAPYDAGTLPDDGGFGEDTSAPNTNPKGADAGDATPSVPVDGSEPPGDGAADSSAGDEDSGADASDGSAADDASDALLGEDAHDGSPAGGDASDASPGLEDASDALASDASSASQPDASDAATYAGGPEDASDAAFAVADAGSPFDAAACSGFNLSGDAINGITVTTSPDDGLTFNTSTTDPTVNPVPAADAVVVTVTTSPIGVMEDLALVFTTSNGGGGNPIATVPMSLLAAAPGAVNQTWQASVPPFPSPGAQVEFWVVGHDSCKTIAEAGADYYSNSGGNYHYETE